MANGIWIVGGWMEGGEREGGREGEREGRKEGQEEGENRERAREGGNDGWRNRGREGWRDDEWDHHLLLSFSESAHNNCFNKYLGIYGVIMYKATITAIYVTLFILIYFKFDNKIINNGKLTRFLGASL